MRKVFWKIATCISVVLLTFCIYSCSNDDEDSVGSREMLIGTWNGISYLSQEWENGELTENNIEDFVNGTNRFSIEFKEDGTYQTIGTYLDPEGHFAPSTTKNTGTWSYSGNKLTLDEDADVEKYPTETWTVTKMTETELSYEIRVKSKEDGINYEYNDQFIFTR